MNGSLVSNVLLTKSVKDALVAQDLCSEGKEKESTPKTEPGTDDPPSVGKKNTLEIEPCVLSSIKEESEEESGDIPENPDPVDEDELPLYMRTIMVLLDLFADVLVASSKYYVFYLITTLKYIFL